MSEQAELLEFPCRYPIKAFGKSGDGFSEIVLEIVSQHSEDILHDEMTVRASHGGKYTAVTIVIEAQSKEQVTAISAALVAHPDIIMAL